MLMNQPHSWERGLEGEVDLVASLGEVGREGRGVGIGVVLLDTVGVVRLRSRLDPASLFLLDPQIEPSSDTVALLKGPVVPLNLRCEANISLLGVTIEASTSSLSESEVERSWKDL